MCHEMFNEVIICVMLFSHCIIHQMAAHISVSNVSQISGRIDGRMGDRIQTY